MKHPPYHLRLNKAVDRLVLIEAIMRLRNLTDLSEYTYYGLGGPYLEDFRLLYELCPAVHMVSIEENEETVKRQKFHLPCGTLRLQNDQVKSFLARYDPNGERSIWWLDYTRLENSNFEEFMALLGRVAEDSMVKVTLRAEPRDFFDKLGESRGVGADRFRQMFGALMPDPSADPPRLFEDFARLLQDMLRVAAQRALPSAMGHAFQPVSSFCYADGPGMFTLTGLVCLRGQEHKVRKPFEGWKLANLRWGKPKRIDVPELSTKERLHLQEHLPCLKDPGKALRKALGYLIDDDWQKTEAKLKQYADFHRHLPYFMRATP